MSLNYEPIKRARTNEPGWTHPWALPISRRVSTGSETWLDDLNLELWIALALMERNFPPSFSGLHELSINFLWPRPMHALVSFNSSVASSQYSCGGPGNERTFNSPWSRCFQVLWTLGLLLCVASSTNSSSTAFLERNILNLCIWSRLLILKAGHLWLHPWRIASIRFVFFPVIRLV